MVKGIGRFGPAFSNAGRDRYMLGPTRLPTTVARPHDGTSHHESQRDWGTDATATLADGQVTIFGAIDHCTAECVGLHAAKYGTRFEALNRCARACGITLATGAATGLDGSQYMSDDFQAELRFLASSCLRGRQGIERSSAPSRTAAADVEDLQQALRTFKET